MKLEPWPLNAFQSLCLLFSLGIFDSCLLLTYSVYTRFVNLSCIDRMCIINKCTIMYIHFVLLAVHVYPQDYQCTTQKAV